MRGSVRADCFVKTNSFPAVHWGSVQKYRAVVSASMFYIRGESLTSDRNLVKLHRYLAQAAIPKEKCLAVLLYRGINK